MPNYTTISETADLMQNKTQAFKIFACSSDIDLGLFAQKAAGVYAGKMKVTLVKPDGTQVPKTATDDEVRLINTNPPKIAVLIDGPGGDIDFTGALKLFPEFKIDDSWVQDDVIEVMVNDDPTPDTTEEG